ncbi:hypothetical protein A4A49_03292 [Nicotiana attenuata]|uniref:Retrotransposon gag domain-containing protein n=1 Tax=Nicotiana attenuata TaxID=49451 RepID=A0A314L2N0_NICAT|nr:hypothetical protein A4A49_03292 [Nicotiana attenuata]
MSWWETLKQVSLLGWNSDDYVAIIQNYGFLRLNDTLSFYGISENNKLTLASSYLDGEALKWYQWLFRNKQLADWEHFTEKVLIRFRKRCLEPLKGHLAAIKEYSTEIEAQVFDKMSHGCCSKVFDTEQSDVKVLTDTTTSTLNFAKSEEVQVFDGSSHINKSESVSTFETGQSVDDNSSITTASSGIPGPAIRVADEEISTTTIDNVINDNFCENDSLLQSSCETLQIEVTAAAFDNGTDISLYLVPITSLVVSIGYNQHVTPPLSCAMYKLRGEPIANSFVCSVDDATTQIEEQYLIDQLRSFLSGRALELSELYHALTFTLVLWFNETIVFRDELPQCVAAITKKPSIGINSTFSIPCDLAMFDIHKVLDDYRNQLLVGRSKKVYPQHGLELAQRLEELPCTLSASKCDQFINMSTFDSYNTLGHAALLILHQFFLDQFGIDFPFDPGTSLLTTSLIVTRNCGFCDALGNLKPNRFKRSTSGTFCITLLAIQGSYTVDAYEGVTAKSVGKNILIEVAIGGLDSNYAINDGTLRKLGHMHMCNISFRTIIKLAFVSSILIYYDTRKEVECTIIIIDLKVPYGVMNQVLQLSSGPVVSTIVLLVRLVKDFTIKYYDTTQHHVKTHPVAGTIERFGGEDLQIPFDPSSALDGVFGTEAIPYIVAYCVNISLGREENDSIAIVTDVTADSFPLVQANTVALSFSSGNDAEEEWTARGIADIIAILISYLRMFAYVCIILVGNPCLSSFYNSLLLNAWTDWEVYKNLVEEFQGLQKVSFHFIEFMLSWRFATGMFALVLLFS